jgi:hypothetical protein
MESGLSRSGQSGLWSRSVMLVHTLVGEVSPPTDLTSRSMTFSKQRFFRALSVLAVVPLGLAPTAASVVPGPTVAGKQDGRPPTSVICAHGDPKALRYRSTPPDCDFLQRRGTGPRRSTSAKDLHWTSWGGQRARGEGVAMMRGGHQVPAKVVLSEPVNVCGIRAYSKVRTRNPHGEKRYLLYTCLRP